MTRYQRQLLELICDKLEIDYSEQKQQAMEQQKAAQAKRDQRIAEIDACSAEKLPSQIRREKEEAEAERLRNLSPHELADLRAAYISADQAASVAWDAYFKASSDESVSPIERDQIHDEWQRLTLKAYKMRKSLKIAQGVDQ